MESDTLVMEVGESLNNNALRSMALLAHSYFNIMTKNIQIIFGR